MPCGLLSSVALGFLGLCLYELLTCVHVGRLLVALRVLYGKMVPCILWCILGK